MRSPTLTLPPGGGASRAGLGLLSCAVGTRRRGTAGVPPLRPVSAERVGGRRRRLAARSRRRSPDPPAGRGVRPRPASRGRPAGRRGPAAVPRRRGRRLPGPAGRGLLRQAPAGPGSGGRPHGRQAARRPVGGPPQEALRRVRPRRRRHPEPVRAGARLPARRGAADVPGRLLLPGRPAAPAADGGDRPRRRRPGLVRRVRRTTTGTGRRPGPGPPVPAQTGGDDATHARAVRPARPGQGRQARPSPSCGRPRRSCSPSTPTRTSASPPGAADEPVGHAHDPAAAVAAVARRRPAATDAPAAAPPQELAVYQTGVPGAVAQQVSSGTTRTATAS